MTFKQFQTSSGKVFFLGKNAENNDELVEKFRGKDNIILHTAKPGSPFCVIEDLKPTKKDIKESAIACASKSQDWRDNRQDVLIHQFTGKNIYKLKLMKLGTWGLKSKPKLIKLLKRDIELWQSKNSK
jgi:predicted ribosome quality control (RQC) complex YloA/Tae2 family protein